MSSPATTLKKHHEKFHDCIKLNSALRHIKAGSLCHDMYRHYTSLEALLGMINSGSLWLTLGKSAKLDDAQEREKFGVAEMWERTYLASFVHDVEESAAMWGLYCRGSNKAVCVSFPRKAMKSWLIMLHKLAKKREGVLINPQKGGHIAKKSVKEVGILDIAYADVARSYSDRERQNFVSWDGLRSRKITALEADMIEPEVTGMLKDYEWNFEHETRVLVRLKEAEPRASKIAVPLHDDLLKKMSIIFGPWLRKEDKRKFENKIKNALHGKKIFNHIGVSESSLSGALNKWECGIV